LTGNCWVIVRTSPSRDQSAALNLLRTRLLGFESLSGSSRTPKTSPTIRSTILARRHKPACSANSAQFSCFPQVVVGNSFDRLSAGPRTGIDGKTGNRGWIFRQCAGFGLNFGRVQDARWAQQPFNGSGCDGKGPSFVLYPELGLLLGISTIFLAGHGISFIGNFLFLGEYKTARAGTLLALPFKRCLALMGAIACAFAIAFYTPNFSSTTAFAMLLIVFKVLWDYRLHTQERRNLRA
jgi:hypothetical protein